ncbi:MAG: hypothetical protein K2O88_04310 [Paramuribaculum sp.]|nr:hypothetical protein [Paramuribaculum sp.]
MTKLTRKNNQTSFQINEITHNGGVTQCVNLRHTTLFSTERLTVAPQPEPKYSYKLIPLTSLPLTGEQLLYSPADSEGHANLYCCTNHGEPHLIQKINGEPKCAIPTESGAIVMTSDGPIEFKRKNNGWTCHPNRPSAFPVTITAAPKGTLTQPMPPVKMELTTSGQTTAPTNESLTRLRNTMLTTYNALSTEALSGGVWIQPIGIRYRVLDSMGNELWRSPISIIGIDGWQCTNPLTGSLSGSDTSYTSSNLHIAAKSFAINVHIKALPENHPWHQHAASVVIEATPQLHPLITDRLPRTNISGITSNNPQFSAWLPGIQPESIANTKNHTTKLKWLTINPDPAMTRIGRIDLTSDTHTLQLTPIGSPTVTEEVSTIESASKHALSEMSVPTDHPLSQLITSGHQFSAECVVQNGDTTIWGNISLIYNNSQQPPTASDTTESPWQAALRVYIDGSSYVIRYPGEGLCPTALSPLILIEHPRATTATFYVQQTQSGKIYEATVNLSPIPNGALAAHISDNLRPIQLTQSQLSSLPAATAYAGTEERMPGAVVVTNSTEPLKVLCGSVCSQGEIKALAGAVKSQSSWDFSRCHIYAFATDGIYTVAANTSTCKVSASRIDSRGISDNNAVAPTPQGVVALIENTPVICTASSVKPITPQLKPITYPLNQVAWHSYDNELYFADNQGNITVLSQNGWHQILLPERVEQLRPYMGKIWFTGTENSYVTTNAQNCHIEWKCLMSQPSPARVYLMNIPMFASHFNGIVELRAHNGAGSEHSQPITSILIDGELNSPLTIRILAPWRRELSLSIKGDASSDFYLTSPNITISSPLLR